MKLSKGKFAKFISSKGFYVAIALCLTGAGAATWLAVDRPTRDIETNNSQVISQTSAFEELPIVEEVEKKQPDIPKVSVPSSSSSIPSSSSQPASAQALAPQESSVPVEGPPPSPTLSYTLPVKGDVVNQFSKGELVKNTTLNDWRTHDGVDITADKGVEILAAADGAVSEIKNDPLWGTVLTITHLDGKQTVYSGLSDVVPVKAGENVLAKQSIGKLEGVPCEASELTHLHFAVKQDNAWVDPLSVIAN